MWIRSKRLINYLVDNGLFPVYETKEEAYFIKDYTLKDLMDSYTIANDCFPNKGMIPKRKLWLL